MDPCQTVRSQLGWAGRGSKGTEGTPETPPEEVKEDFLEVVRAETWRMRSSKTGRKRGDCVEVGKRCKFMGSAIAAWTGGSHLEKPPPGWATGCIDPLVHLMELRSFFIL